MARTRERNAISNKGASHHSDFQDNQYTSNLLDSLILRFYSALSAVLGLPPRSNDALKCSSSKVTDNYKSGSSNFLMPVTCEARPSTGLKLVTSIGLSKSRHRSHHQIFDWTLGIFQRAMGVQALAERDNQAHVCVTYLFLGKSHYRKSHGICDSSQRWLDEGEMPSISWCTPDPNQPDHDAYNRSS